MQARDVVIIGGGISGLGVALEAARRGLSTLIIERNTCATATSNNTLRIIHGGFRYLQNGDLPRVIQSLCDQRDLLRELPELIKPFPCLMPLNRFGLKSQIPVSCAALMYGAFMKLYRSPLSAPRIVSARFVDAEVPLLCKRAPHGALLWHDALMTNPLQVAAYLIEKLSQHNTTILEHTSAISVAKSSSGFLSVRSNSGELFEARAVVSTLGPWVGTVQLSSELQPGPRPLWCKGFNLIINRQLDPRYGIGFESRDGRLFFCTPRDQGTAIGTWYLPYADDPSTVSATQSDITNFLDAFNQAVPGASISPTEVVALDVGVLPMTGISPRGPKLQAHETITNHQNFIEVISTKYTTFRSQGQRVVRAIGAAAVR